MFKMGKQMILVAPWWQPETLPQSQTIQNVKIYCGGHFGEADAVGICLLPNFYQTKKIDICDYF